MTDELSRRLAAGPGCFLHSLDLAGDRVLSVELTEAQIAEASFLDQRLLGPQTRGQWLALAEITGRAAAAPRDDAHYIFHIGHVGSTLVSRLLGRLPQVLALREPLLLRGIADVLGRRDAVDMPWDPATVDERVDILRRFLARTFRADQRAVIKATSFTSEIAPALVAPAAKALFLYVSPESYMRTILAGDNSRVELAALTGPRLVRLARRLATMPYRAWSLGEGERAALAWTTEMLSLTAAADALPPGAVLWLDFDRFLAEPAISLAAIARHFALPLDEAAAARLAVDPLMQRYSKAPEHGYSADLRRQLQAQAEREHGPALRRGRDWLAQAAAHDAGVARLQERRG